MKSLRIITVDDDDDARGLARLLLEGSNYEVEEADGADALFSILRTHPEPSAILLDLTLEGGPSGWQILRSLKDDAVNANVPVIVVSGRDDDQFRDAALDMGARAYVTKPYAARDLVKAVGANVRGGRTLAPWAV